MDDWRRELRDVRERLNLSRTDASRLSGVTPDTIKSYELGRRKPSRHHLAAVLKAYRLDHDSQRRIFGGAGFVGEDRSEAPGSGATRYWFTAAEAEAEVQRQRWPAFVLDEFSRVVAANDIVQSLWGVDLRHEFTNPVERNLLSVASNPRFADRCLNWDEAISIILAVFKAHDWAPESVEDPGPYFAAVMEHFLKGDPKYVGRFFKLWEAAPGGWDKKERWSYPMVWDEPGIGIMRFECLATPASHTDGLAFNDWLPVDAATWMGLEQVKTRRGRRD